MKSLLTVQSLMIVSALVLSSCSGAPARAVAAADSKESADSKELAKDFAKDFDSKDLSALLIQNTSGDIKIYETSGRAKVVATKKKFGPTCEMKIERHENTLGVIVKNRGFVNTDDCKVDFEIQVPKKIRVDVTLGAGNIELKDLDTELTYKIGSGNIRGDGRFEKVMGEAGSGSTFFKGLTGDGTFKVGSGTFDLSYLAAPLKGSLKVDVASGDVMVSFPKGSKIRTQLQSVTGRVTNELGEAPNASFSVAMKAATGNLKIHSY